MGNFSWEDEIVSDYDIVAEEAADIEAIAAQQAQEPVIVEADEEEIEEILSSSAFDLDEEEAGIVYNTRIRLEQAKLYEMLINHNLFDGVDVDHRAIAIVRNELKHYVVKRLEILMGLKSPVAPKQVVESDFNSIEVDFLKQLAAKGTRGRSMEVEAATDEEMVAEQPQPVSGGLNPIAGKRIKSSDLKPLVKKPAAVLKKAVQPPVQEKKKQAVKKRATPKQTVNRPQKKKTVEKRVKLDSPLQARNLTPAEAEALAKEDLKLMKNRKPLHEMTAKEKAEEIARVNAKHTVRPKPNTNVAPPVSESQLFNKYTIEQANRSNGVGGQGGNPFDSIMANLANNIAMSKNQE